MTDSSYFFLLWIVLHQNLTVRRSIKATASPLVLILTVDIPDHWLRVTHRLMLHQQNRTSRPASRVSTCGGNVDDRTKFVSIKLSHIVSHKTLKLVSPEGSAPFFQLEVIRHLENLAFLIRNCINFLLTGIVNSALEVTTMI